MPASQPELSHCRESLAPGAVPNTTPIDLPRSHEPSPMTEDYESALNDLPCAEVWARAQANDRQAIAYLASRIRLYVQSKAKSLVKLAEVEDLVQEVALSVLGSLCSLRCPKNFEGFLWNRARAKAKRIQSRRPRPMDVDAEILENAADPAPPPGAESIEHELRAALRACLEQLPSRLRSCVQRRYTNSESAREIARTLSLSHTAINDRLRSGLHALSMCLENKGVQV